MKVVLAFDSFKGSLSAQDVCETVARAIQSVRPDAEVVLLPMADGGEGTAAALLGASGGEWRPVTVAGPLPGRIVQAGFAWLPKTKTAVVEMASASGLPLLKPEEYNPLIATTFGTGELIRAAAAFGAKRILLAVGGSATVDGGVGAAEALGWKFQADGTIVAPERLCLPEIEVLCDVTNPLCGSNGAACVYGPQKGASPSMVIELDARLRYLAERVQAMTGKNIAVLPGAGAAGGLAFGAVAFMGGRLVSGVDAVMKTAGLADSLRGAQWVLTGEGCFDSQSLQGKVIDGVTRSARAAGAKTAVIAGSIQLAETAWRAAGVDKVMELKRPEMSVRESMSRARELLRDAAVVFAQDL